MTFFAFSFPDRTFIGREIKTRLSRQRVLVSLYKVNGNDNNLLKRVYSYPPCRRSGEKTFATVFIEGTRSAVVKSSTLFYQSSVTGSFFPETIGRNTRMNQRDAESVQLLIIRLTPIDTEDEKKIRAVRGTVNAARVATKPTITLGWLYWSSHAASFHFGHGA